MTKQIIIWMLSIVLLGGIAFCTIWTITNFDKVKQATTGTNIYDASDIENSYKDGYDNALKDKDDYMALIDSYHEQMLNLQDTISQLTTDKTNLQNDNTAKGSMIANLQYQISNLTELINSKDFTIAGLQAEKETLLSQLAYMEELLSAYADSNKLVVKFMCEDELYNLQLIEPNGMANSIQAPFTSTTYKEFKGWSLDGITIVDPASYQITANTIFIAVIEYHNSSVMFVMDGNTIEMQNVPNGEFAIAPIVSKPYYIFKGWKVNGNYVVPSTYEITANTTFVADFGNINADTYSYTYNAGTDDEPNNKTMSFVVSADNKITSLNFVGNSSYPISCNIDLAVDTTDYRVDYSANHYYLVSVSNGTVTLKFYEQATLFGVSLGWSLIKEHDYSLNSKVYLFEITDNAITKINFIIYSANCNISFATDSAEETFTFSSMYRVKVRVNNGIATITYQIYIPLFGWNASKILTL
jgi:hypothetical protein